MSKCGLLIYVRLVRCMAPGFFLGMDSIAVGVLQIYMILFA